MVMLEESREGGKKKAIQTSGWEHSRHLVLQAQRLPGRSTLLFVGSKIAVVTEPSKRREVMRGGLEEHLGGGGTSCGVWEATVETLCGKLLVGFEQQSDI